MMVLIALGLGAGLVSALLFAAAGTGSIPAVLLMYLAPLPILIVALGWHHLLGLLALACGALATTMLMRPAAGTAFALGPALCAWVLAYAALARRPELRATAERRGSVGLLPDGWYPVGWLLLILGVAGGLIALGSLAAAMGGDYASYEEALKQVISALVSREPRGARPGQPPTSDLLGSDFVRILVALAPALLAGMLTLILGVNLWLAGKVVAISGRLSRPWPDIAAARMPAAAVAAALVGTFLSQSRGFVGVAGAALAGGLTMAFALQGLALLHFVSRHRPGRGLLLSVAYFLTIVLGYVFLPAFALIGMADTMLPLRRMLGRAGHPPFPPKPPQT